MAFFLAFTVVAFYGRSNHAFVARLHHLSGRLVTVNLVLLGFVVLLPSPPTRWGSTRSRWRRPSSPATSR